MTLPLTDSQKQDIRIALAKFEGRNHFRWGFDYQHEEGWEEAGPWYDSLEEAEREWKTIYDGPHHAREIQRFIYCPNYPADLNACAEIEVKLTDEQHARFEVYLRRLIADRFGMWRERELLSATAEVRSLALYQNLKLDKQL